MLRWLVLVGGATVVMADVQLASVISTRKCVCVCVLCVCVFVCVAVIPVVFDYIQCTSPLTISSLAPCISVLINGILFTIFALLFECLRSSGGKVDIYMPKVRGEAAALQPKAGFFAWAVQILQLDDNLLLERVGLDGYVLARWLRMVSLVGGICSFFAMTVLLPVYYTAAGDAHGMNLMTMANIYANGYVRMYTSIVQCFLLPASCCFLY
jgi:hypothetical protein